jgi:predicted phosphodiesterase
MRALVISDIHSNDDALSAVLSEHPRVDEIWCLGDIVGYGGAPRECIGLLRNCGLPMRSVAGNHDLAVSGKLALSKFIPEGRDAISWTTALLEETERRWLDRASSCLFPADDLSLFHGSPRDPVWEYLYSISVAETALEDLTTKIGLFGHTHVPMIYYRRDKETADRLAPRVGGRIDLKTLGNRVLINPGSVGQPRDRDQRASYMVLDMESAWVEFHKADYPISEAQKKIRAAGLPDALADRLQYGI